MRLRHIEIFHAIMQAGSLSGAADLLSISQPAASKILAQAEHSLGIALFKRLPGGLKPTPEAILLFQETKSLYSSLERVRNLARNLLSHPGGLLRIGCIPSLGLGPVPQAVADFARLCPGVSISLRTENNETLSALLLAQEIDVAVAFEPTARAGIAIEELGKARAVFVGPIGAGYENRQEPVHLVDLDFSKWIGLDSTDPLGLKINSTLASLDMRNCAPMIEVKTYYVAKALVDSGMGFTIIDEFTAKAAGGSSPVVQLQPEMSIGVYVMTSSSNPGTQALKVLTQQLAKRMQNP
ncbi:LysR family transcriptional regulator [Paraburkholderia sp. Ac-20336]|uniref:LysR family transcriptional regulator n=1 Tax=unclassified Paraburkholderia TaxID=2615204 RepID=UPI001981E75E|nr:MULTISPECIES: LysR family transcriptional regulator [unclassified Paraburkholderia]MBN3804372.1 LysR family transcriptional regulator [Paraburkholderia sp. Ac-20336]MBN3851372.1 LysR family transcriptional regulator [Paraburkholderia sp. Ac-20342]